MRLSLEEMVAFAIKYQPFILELELQKGGTLTYLDEHGNYVSRYPDGILSLLICLNVSGKTILAKPDTVSGTSEVAQSHRIRRNCRQIYPAR